MTKEELKRVMEENREVCSRMDSETKEFLEAVARVKIKGGRPNGKSR